MSMLSTRFAIVLLGVLASACGRGLTDAACIPGTYSASGWPPSYWVQPLPELEETVAHVPPGAFLLVRSSKGVEAIRLLDVSEGEMCGCATYEVYRVSPGGKPPSTLSSSGRVSEFRVRGIHLLTYQPGHSSLRDATGSLRYMYPTQIGVGKPNDVAGSAWTSIGDVDPGNQKLKWFRYDQDGSRTAGARNFNRAELP